MKLPFFQFYPADWVRDTRVLSLAAKGAWADVLCTLHTSKTRGTSTLSLTAWARIIGATPTEADAVLTELGDTGVCDIERQPNTDVTLTCRRMLREEITKQQTRLRVKKHRDKKRQPQQLELSNAGSERQSNDSVTPKKPETRSQIGVSDDTPRGDGSASPQSPPPAKVDDAPFAPIATPERNDPIAYQAVIDLFNRLCTPAMPRASLTEHRRATIRARWQAVRGEEPLAWFERLFTKAAASDFLCGRAQGTTFRGSFDWITGVKNAPKVVEGNYDNRTQQGGGTPWEIR